jgi:hypothetical protein
MYNYCTLFDSNYLIRGLAMYESLKTYSKNFHLYIFAFDELTEKILREINYPDITVISLTEFEDAELLSVKPTRTKEEYCWTSTPSTLKYCIEKFKLNFCTYVDADIYFYNDPSCLIEEMGDKSVLITPHWYTPVYDQSATSGIYCVQFITFKNTSEGMKILEWWRRSCIEWCYARFEDGKFGDQKYLDNWPEKFKGVHVLKNKGGGVAPWNVQQYNLEDDSKLMIIEKKTGKQFPLIFYHYHNLKFLPSGDIDLGSYFLNQMVIRKLYLPYISHLIKIFKNLQELGFTIDLFPKTPVQENWKIILKRNFAKLNIFNKFFFSLFNNIPETFWNKRDNNFLLFFKRGLRLLTLSNNIIKIPKEEKWLIF